MSKFGPEVSPNGAPALPLWIGGRAYLTVVEGFFDVRGGDGAVLRRVPLCGTEEVAAAVDSAAQAIATWQAMDVPAREAAFATLHELLARYRGHLAKLLVEEAGLPPAAAETELERALATAAGVLPKAVGCAGDVVAVVNDLAEPLAEPLACIIEALLAGDGVVLKPSVRAPSALLALAELFTRAGFPGGVVNLVQGDEAAVRALAVHRQVAALACLAAPPFCAAVSGMLTGSGKALAMGRGDATLAHWRELLGVI